ncbi:deoxyribonuclease IV [Slackia heliotrinireducens]|uniref:deoxyribonuclease IV n=1 Tax=Slackia heliotrinireducens TaxID=84110 RepID=UPI00331614E2
MLHIGCHLSSSAGFLAMGKTATEIGADTFAFFTRNPRGGSAKAIDPADAQALCDHMAQHGFAPLVAHAPYTLNPCSDKERTREFALQAMADDLVRMESVPNSYYNFHPGSHVGQGSEAAIEMIADLLNQVLRPEQTTTVLLETMSGKGSEVGRTFEELAAIIERVELESHLGVCFDTCHVFDGGYDIVNDLDGVLDEFDRVMGLDRLRAVHINDSKNPCGSHKDRHETIGNGHIGLEAFARIVRHPALRDLPFILETPNELPGYAAEIEMLRSLAEGAEG